MQIRLNGQESEIPDNTTLLDLVKKTSGYPERIIAEVNGHIINSDIWNTRLLKTDDSVELLTFVGGG